MFFALFNKTNIIQDILAYIDHINNLDPSDHQSLFTILFNLIIGLIKQMKLIAMTLHCYCLSSSILMILNQIMQ